MKKWMMGIGALVIAIGLAACGGNDEKTPEQNPDTENNPPANVEGNGEDDNSMQEMNDHSEMDHSSSGEVPEDLTDAASPTYPFGSEAVMHANHMKGMNEAVATIEGAYETTVYAVTYTPTNGGEKVENHKWVIHEEVENASDEPYKQGDDVVLQADHMKGMEGASATIDTAEQTTVYMVSYEDTETGEKVENHKWVTEEELSPVE